MVHVQSIGVGELADKLEGGPNFVSVNLPAPTPVTWRITGIFALCSHNEYLRLMHCYVRAHRGLLNLRPPSAFNKMVCLDAREDMNKCLSNRTNLLDRCPG